MSFLTYQNVRPWAKAIKAAVTTKKMPPWNADPRYGHFGNDRSLKQGDIDTLVAWADSGAAEGDAKDAPVPVKWPGDGWQIQPDYIAKGPAFTVAAHPKNNVLEWNTTIMPSGLTKDTWITTMELKPSAPSVTHHICIRFVPHRPDVKYGVTEWIDKDRDAAGLEKPRPPGVKSQVTENTRGINAPLEICYVPGGQAADYRAFGSGKLIPAGTDIIWDTHYTPNGTETVDRPELGFTVAKTEPARRYISSSITSFSDAEHFAIPPNSPDWTAPTGEVLFMADADLVWLSPHMHVRGKSMTYRLTYPDGRTETLLSVPHYDFNWQLGYELATPLKIPKGSKITSETHYDNSVNNKFNPDPNQTVYYGNMTWEEMNTAFFGIVVDKSVDPTKVVKRPRGAQADGA
jgi:hypothetical protein